jgi:acetolactate synthase-1/2/3 large subunit
VIAAAEAILAAERPVFYVGGGAVSANVDPAELIRVAEAARIPVITTLMAKGVFPDSHPLCIGLPGMHGSKAANWAMNRADLLIACGSRFDDRVTGKLDAFAPGARSFTWTSTRPRSTRTGPPRSRSWARSSWSSRSWPRRSSRA